MAREEEEVFLEDKVPGKVVPLHTNEIPSASGDMCCCVNTKCMKSLLSHCWLVQRYTFSISDARWRALSRRRGRLRLGASWQSCDVRVIPNQQKLLSLENQAVGKSQRYLKSLWILKLWKLAFHAQIFCGQFEICSQGEIEGEGRRPDGRLVESLDYADDKKCPDKRVFSLLMCSPLL